MKAFVALCVALGVCSFATAADIPSQLEDIREAAFRYLFEHNPSSQQKKAAVYFLSFLNGRNSKEARGTDPGDVFMRRFANQSPRVAKGSEARIGRDGVRDQKTHEKGIIFNLGEVRWLADDSVEIDGGHYEAGLSASGNTYFLKKKSGKWAVEKMKAGWISDAMPPARTRETMAMTLVHRNETGLASHDPARSASASGKNFLP
jgi:hypothetical protein